MMVSYEKLTVSRRYIFLCVFVFNLKNLSGDILNVERLPTVNIIICSKSIDGKSFFKKNKKNKSFNLMIFELQQIDLCQSFSFTFHFFRCWTNDCTADIHSPQLRLAGCFFGDCDALQLLHRVFFVVVIGVLFAEGED